MAKLAYSVKGSPIEFEFDPGQTEYTIGRNPRCDIRINNPSISRKHAEIRYDARTKQFTVFDLNSSNGTFVNGKRTRSQTLTHGDEVVCGEFKFLFMLHATASATDGHGAARPHPGGFRSGPTPELDLSDEVSLVSGESDVEADPYDVTHFPHSGSSPGVISAGENTQLRAEVEALAAEVDRLQRQNGSLSAMRAENDQLKRERDELEAQARDFMRQLDFAESRVVELETAKDALEKDIQSCSDLDTEAKRLREDNDELSAKVRALEHDLETRQIELRQAQQAVERAKATQSQAIELRGLELEEALADVDKARADAKKAQDDAAAARAELRDATRALAGSEETRQELKRALADLTGELRELVQLNDELRTQLERKR